MTDGDEGKMGKKRGRAERVGYLRFGEMREGYRGGVEKESKSA